VGAEKSLEGLDRVMAFTCAAIGKPFWLL
jgi:hypothetical protein